MDTSSLGEKSVKALRWEYIYSQKLKIYHLHKNGVSMADLAKRFDVSEKLIKKAIQSSISEFGKV